MKILVVGGGGREHAIAWQLTRSSGITVVACPGNPGIATLGRCVAVPASIKGYADLAEAEQVDLTVVGPEAPLVAGIVDEFQQRKLPIVGPTKAAAQLEGSKIFAKQFFERAGIPTARSVQTENLLEAKNALRQFALPVVIKADGLAAGKGVIIAFTAAEAEIAIEKLGPSLVIEEFLEGEEVSFIGLSNGKDLLPLEASQDHKRLNDEDAGPNTGGMGAYSDGRILSSEETEQVINRVMYPAIHQMNREGKPFRGFLYAGLMMTNRGPQVLEFNVRLGDPETQALMHRLESGFVEALEFAAGKRQTANLVWKPQPSVCIVMAAAGYPDAPQGGDPITGITEAEEIGATVFQAGTKFIGGQLLTNGGRVLGVTASGDSLLDAAKAAYQATGRIHFPGQHYRHDIGVKGLWRWKD